MILTLFRATLHSKDCYRIYPNLIAFDGGVWRFRPKTINRSAKYPLPVTEWVVCGIDAASVGVPRVGSK